MVRFLKSHKFWYAVATLVGSTVGVGFYGIPFAFAKASFGVGLIFLCILGGFILLTNLLYGEIVLRTHRRHQFVGYVNQYLGPGARRLNIFNFWIAVYGSMVGIIIISGQFLANIFAPFLHVPLLSFSTVFIIIASVLIYLGLRTVARFDFVMIFVLLAFITFLVLSGLKHIDLQNYSVGMTDFWFLPFGVILFATNGITGIPLVRELLIGSEHKLRPAIIVGTLIPLVLYLCFSIIVVGISGNGTTPDAISGLQPFLGSWILYAGSILGFLTSLTIFLNLATALRESLHEDFGFKWHYSWLVVALGPYLLFLFGMTSFIDIIALVGGISISIDLILLVFVYIHARRRGDRMPEYSFRVPNWLLYSMMGIFVLGALYTLFLR